MIIRIVWAWAFCLALVATGCSGAGVPVVPHPANHEVGEKPKPLVESEMCLGGIGLGKESEGVRGMVKAHGRRFGGFDFTVGKVDVYLNESGDSVEMIRGGVSDLCPTSARIKEAGKSATAAEVREAYGAPFSVATTANGEYWFFGDEKRTSVLVFRFQPRENGAVTAVYAARFQTAVVQWFPHLGETEGARPLSVQDAAVGPFLIGMDADQARSATEETPSEGQLSPYGTLIFRRTGLELHHDNYVRAVYAAKGPIQTPRGITVGSSTNSVRAAYGQPRVATLGETEQVWAYDSLLGERSLLFWIRGSQVERIAAYDTAYVHRLSIR